jgi:hypothetical protein
LFISCFVCVCFFFWGNHNSSSDDEEESQQLEGPSSSHKRRKGKKRGEKTGTPARAKSRSPTPPPVESSERAMATFWETLRNLTHASEAQRQIYEANHRKEQEKLFDTLMALNDPNAPASYSTLATDDPLATSCNAADYPPGHNFGTPITLTAQMVLDPRYATSTSRELIDRLERPNTFTMRSVCPPFPPSISLSQHESWSLLVLFYLIFFMHLYGFNSGREVRVRLSTIPEAYGAACQPISRHP